MNIQKKPTLKTLCLILLFAVSSFNSIKVHAQATLYLDYNIANFDDGGYIWRYNSLFNSTDTALNYCGLALDTLGGYNDPADPAGSWTYWGDYFATPYPSNLNMYIDSIFLLVTHENNSGNTDVFRMKIVELNANGTLSNNTLWQDEQFSNVSLSPNGNWLGNGAAFYLEFAPAFSVPIGTKVGLVFEYEDPSKLDTLGIYAGYVDNGLGQALQSTWKNSFMRYPPFINNISKNSSVGYGTPVGSSGWYEAQNWGFTAKVTLTSSIPPPTANFSLNASSICAGSCISPSNSTTGTGVTYNWSFPGANPSTSNSQNPGAVCYNSPGTYSVTLVAQNAGGTSTFSQTIVVNNPLFSLNISSDATTVGSVLTICNGDLVTFNANTFPNANVNYQWKKNGVNIGTNSPTLAINNLQVADVITCLASDQNNCSVQSNQISIGLVNSTSFFPDFTASQTNITAPPFDVTFFNTTPNSGNYAFMWYYGDGTSSNAFSPTHTYPTNGLYTVVLEAQSGTTGCKAITTKANYIVCTGSSQNCSQIVNVSPFGNITACEGGTLELVATTNASNPTYQWLINGVPIGGATQSIYIASISASYSVMVYENGNCPVTSSQVNISFSNPTPPPPVITQSGQLLPCSQGFVTLSASVGGGANLEWSNGSTSSSIGVTQGGTYTVTATYNNGCENTATSVLISPSNATNPGICLVTVDTLTNSNYIIWEPTLTADIDSFYIYKEINQANVYIKIGAVDYFSLSEYNDLNSNPQVQGYRYKIAALDTCGALTFLSNHHKTIHLQVFPGVSTNRQLSWSNYEGINFASYQIWRRLPGQQFQILVTLPSNLNTYTDINPPSLDADYRVEFNLPQDCNSVDRAPHGKSKSNVGNNQAIFTEPDGLNDSAKLLANLNLIPNPSDGNSTLQWESIQPQNLQITVTDVVGKVLFTQKVNAQKGLNKMNLSTDAAGVYFVSIYGESGSRGVLKMVVR
jgi:hypothetical protein